MQLLCIEVLLNHVFSINTTDAVVRNVYFKYFHPKEALVSNGVLNRLVVAVCIVFLTHIQFLWSVSTVVVMDYYSKMNYPIP